MEHKFKVGDKVKCIGIEEPVTIEELASETAVCLLPGPKHGTVPLAWLTPIAPAAVAPPAPPHTPIEPPAPATPTPHV